MSSEYFFLVAEASAISSAPNTMSRGTFFSRASTSASITSSRFPAIRVVATRPSQFRHQPRALDVVERQRDLLFSVRCAFQLQAHMPLVRAAQHADEAPPPGRVRRAHAHIRLVTGEAREIHALAKRP